MTPRAFVMAGGGSGGHVIPALAVARELRESGHAANFVGTRRGMGARLVPAAGFAIEFIEIGGLKSVGFRRAVASLDVLSRSIFEGSHRLCRMPPAGVDVAGW